MKRLRVLVSLITQENDYQLEQAAASEEAANRLGLDLEVLYADSDSILQSQQILKFVQAEAKARPDAIILEPVGGPALPQVARAAVSAGISWVVLNREVGYVRELRQSPKVPVFCVASDNLEIGRIQGRQFAALLPRGGSVLYIQGPSETDACKLRTLGMYETRPANIQVKTMKGNWTEASAFKAITAWLRLATSQHTQLDMVAAQNDAMAVGAKKAFQQFSYAGQAKDRWLSIPFIGCDGVARTGQAWVRSGLLTATVVAPPLAGTALEMLSRALQTGVAQPEITFIAPRSLPAVENLSATGTTQGSRSAAATRA
jgi:ribose transport system substrate-binding protein